MNTKKEHAKIDWMITLVPLAIVIALCVLFFWHQNNRMQY